MWIGEVKNSSGTIVSVWHLPTDDDDNDDNTLALQFPICHSFNKIQSHVDSNLLTFYKTLWQYTFLQRILTTMTKATLKYSLGTR